MEDSLTLRYVVFVYTAVDYLLFYCMYCTVLCYVMDHEAQPKRREKHHRGPL